MNQELSTNQKIKAKEFFGKLKDAELKPLLLLPEYAYKTDTIMNLCRSEKLFTEMIHHKNSYLSIIEPSIFTSSNSHYSNNPHLNIYKNENAFSDVIALYLRKSKEFRNELLKILSIKQARRLSDVSIEREKSLLDNTTLANSGRADITISLKVNNKSKIIFIEHKIFHNFSESQINKYCKVASLYDMPYFILLTSKDRDILVLKTYEKLMSKYFEKVEYINHIDLAKIYVNAYCNSYETIELFFISWLYSVGKSFFYEKNISRSINHYYFRCCQTSDYDEENIVNIFLKD